MVLTNVMMYCHLKGTIGERALTPVLPKEMPFTLRLTSQVLASNGKFYKLRRPGASTKSHRVLD